MIFSFLKPEINSTLMYAGPGSATLAAAAAGWEALANDLQSAATSFQSIVTNLTSGAWTGASSQQMLAGVEPYAGWLTNTSAQAAQTAAQAAASVKAYEAAHAATIPPELVFANRLELLVLIATNFFGQNTPAIAANEMEYATMWATDATAMNTYLAAAMHSTVLPAMAAPPAATNGAAQSAATSPADATSSLLSALNGLLVQLNSAFGSVSGYTAIPDLTGFTTAGLSSWLTGVGSALSTDLGLLGGATTTGVGSSSALFPLQAAYYGAMLASTPARMLMSLGTGAAGGRNAAGGIMTGSETLMSSIGQFVDGKMQSVVGSVAGQLRSWGSAMSSAVSAQLGRASAMGALSVPHAWTEVATGTGPVVSRAAPILPNTSVSAPALTPTAGTMPGGPFGNALMGALSGRGLASMAAKAPKVIPKSPAAG